MADDIRINDPWYQYRNIMGVPSRKKILIGVLFISFVLTLAVIAFTVMNMQYHAKTAKHVQFAAFQSSLNSSVDPCVDFYEFTCDLWSRNNPLPENKYEIYEISTFSILQDVVNTERRSIFENTQQNEKLPNVVNYAIKFFNLCVEASTNISDIYEVLMQFFEEGGGYPLFKVTNWDENMFDWMNTSNYLNKRLGLNLVFDVGINAETSISAIQIKQPRLEEIDFRYLQVTLTKLNISFEIQDFIDTANTFYQWRKLFYSSKNVSDPMVINVKDLLVQVPEINWIRCFQIILSDTNLTVSDNDTIIIPNMNYLKTVGKVLGSNVFSNTQLANLFNTFVLGRILSFVPGYLETYDDFLIPESAEVIKNVTCNNCYDHITKLFQSSLDYLYIKKFSSLNIENSKVLSQNIKSTFLEVLQNSDWIDEESKEAAMLKLSEMEQIIGYPDYFFNKTQFDKLYEKFPAFTNNIVKDYFQIYDFKQNVADWELWRPVTAVSAYYNVQKNKIVFPLSLHNPPFYYSMGPSYLNYGAVGTIIAHEISHGFGEYEKNYIFNILKLSPFNNVTSSLFVERAKCFINKYEKYDESRTYKNDGLRTLRENVADSEGLRIAFKAYKKYKKNVDNETHVEQFSTYTQDQMFFISFGTAFCSNLNLEIASNLNIHSFPNLRVNGAVSNSKSFAEAFNCSNDSLMNPSEKCLMW